MPQPATSLWSIGPSVYLPSLLVAIGQGASLPVIALTALHHGASPGIAGLIVALIGVGKISGGIPAGALASRLGERAMMLWAVLGVIGAMIGCIVAPNLWLLGTAVFVLGATTSAWSLARHTFIAEVIAFELRARAFATMGGVQRGGTFIGPFISAVAIHAIGTDGGYVVGLVMACLAGIVLIVVREVPGGEGSQPQPLGDSTMLVLRRNLRTFGTLGVAAALISSTRSVRQAVIPLYAAHIGLSPVTSTIIFGIAGAADVLLFYPGGVLTDRLGRLHVAVPALLLIGGAYAAMTFTDTAAGMTAAAIGVGLGNGLTAGINMTIGADASSPIGRARFLALWRTVCDTGEGMGPLVLSGVAATAGLAPAIAVMGGMSWLAVGALLRWLPRSRDGNTAL